jgi:peptidoglycan/xylan/chitin deacetylase (PgdA/CDA1 family)
MNKNKIYYLLKPLIRREVQIALRRELISRKQDSLKDVWPIDQEAGKIPSGWEGWPAKKKFAVGLTHNVDTEKGQGTCHDLIDMEKKLGFRSSFHFVPEGYPVSSDIRRQLVKNGFEVGVHGLKHDGKLYSSKKCFQDMALHINRYLKDWESVGFRSPSMHHNLDWIGYLNIEYDASTFDTDPFEPQPDGMKTIFPFWVEGDAARRGYVELPYTLPQDFTLFVLMKEETIDIWKRKLDWIAEIGGMALILTHADYMSFSGLKLGPEEYPAEYYSQLLKYIKSKYDGQYWHAVPMDIARFWKKNRVESRIDQQSITREP